MNDIREKDFEVLSGWVIARSSVDTGHRIFYWFAGEKSWSDDKNEVVLFSDPGSAAAVMKWLLDNDGVRATEVWIEKNVWVAGRHIDVQM